ncbi:MAG: hypothetical protein SFY68_07140 [Candidatus Sumerlaeia bacterium]|nr:hypothetical protein [Candidatus Sumerlaeia bacterium]
MSQKLHLKLQEALMKITGLLALKRSLAYQHEHLIGMERFNFAVSRGMLAQSLRRIDPTNPSTWEFAAFSQNGEDGIVDYCLQHLLKPERTFVEIGASNALENNSSYLAFVKKYCGLMVDGNTELIRFAKSHFQGFNHGVTYHAQMVEPDNIDKILELSASVTPDFFSLDIDGIDFYVAKALYEQGFRPSLVCVEYNSLFGNERSITIPYQKAFTRHSYHSSKQVYGVSLQGWHHFWTSRGYQFITVDMNGVNSFYARVDAFDKSFLKTINPIVFKHNFTLNKYLNPSFTEQLNKLSFTEINN